MKNIFMYIIVIAVVAVGAWLFMRKGSTTTSLYDSSPTPSASATASESATPVATATPAGSPTATPKPGPVIKTASGLQYQEEVVGTGATATSGHMVAVKYTGSLTNGKVFDSTDNHGGQPFTFNLGAGEVIKGWDEGVAGMKVGGKRKLIIPASLGYGSQDVGNGLIPPNSTLIFEVELVAVQ